MASIEKSLKLKLNVNVICNIKKIQLTPNEREKARAALRAAMDMTPAEYMRMIKQREAEQGKFVPIMPQKRLQAFFEKMRGKRKP